MNWPLLDRLTSKYFYAFPVLSYKDTMYVPYLPLLIFACLCNLTLRCSLDGQLRSLEASIAKADPATQQLFSQSTALWLQQQQQQQQQRQQEEHNK